MEIWEYQGHEVKVVSEGEVSQKAFGDRWLDVSYDEVGEAIRAYIEEFDAHYYARPKEDFFIAEAVRETAELGKGIVVVENLS